MSTKRPHATLEDATALWNHCEAFIRDNEIHCAETISQMDKVIENAYEFIEGICDIVGYEKLDDEEQVVKPALNHGKLVRIIETDNFGGDYPGERFHIAPMSEKLAQEICDALNEFFGEHARRYYKYKVVPLDYKLQPGFKP